MRVSLNAVAENWAASVALWALPYLTLLSYLRPEAAASEILQWLLLLIGLLGFVSMFAAAWQDISDPAWRASHGLPQLARSRARVNVKNSARM